MKRIFTAAMVTALLIVSPLAFKFSRDANQYHQQLSAQVDTVIVIRSELAGARDSLVRSLAQEAAESARADSISQLYANASASANRLAAKVAVLNHRVDSISSNEVVVRAQLDDQSNTLAQIHVQMADTTKVLAHVRGQLDTTTAQLRYQTNLISQIQPWYLKWKHDATQRGWLAKLFGAGKAQTPAFPEPSFEASPADTLPSAQGSGLQAATL